MNSKALDWTNPLDPVVTTTSAVAENRLPVLRVVHEEGHGGWQFYDDAEALGTPVVVAKDEIVSSDETLKTILDLPVGWEAERTSRESDWVRREL